LFWKIENWKSKTMNYVWNCMHGSINFSKFLNQNWRFLSKLKKIKTKTKGFFEKLELNNTSHDMNKIQCGFSHLLYVTYLVNPIGSIEGMANYNLSKWLATCNGDNLEMNECDFFIIFITTFDIFSYLHETKIILDFIFSILNHVKELKPN
jgi:hypothetical protein